MGAFTTTFNAFATRIWCSDFSETADVLDCFGSDIRIEKIYGDKMFLRVFPLENCYMNDFWITNLTRYCYDALFLFRVILPMMKIFFSAFFEIGARLVKTSWGFCCSFITKYIFLPFPFDFIEVMGYGGSLVSLESIFIFKMLLTSVGCRFLGIKYDDYFCVSDFRFFYLLNTGMKSLVGVNCVIFIGFNPEFEAPLLGLLLRKRLLESNDSEFKIYSIGLGLSSCFGFKVINILNSVDGLINICRGYHFICQELLKYTRIILILGASLLARFDNCFILNEIISVCCLFNKIQAAWISFNLIYDNSNNVNIFDLGFMMNNVGSRTIIGAKTNIVLKELLYKYLSSGHRIFRNYWNTMLGAVGVPSFFSIINFFVQKKICNYYVFIRTLVYSPLRLPLEMSLESGWVYGFEGTRDCGFKAYKENTWNIWQCTHFCVDEFMGIAECILPTANIGAYFSMFLAINGRLRFLENFLDNSSYKTDLEVFGLFSFFFERLSMKLIPIVNLD